MKPSARLILHLLRVRGGEGVSPLEARKWGGCDRLAARILELRHAGYAIETRRETVAGSTYARYVLTGEPT